MKTIGFYQGTEHTLPGAPDIHQLKNKLNISPDAKKRVVRYLSEAPTAVRSLGTVSLDVLDPEHPEISPHEILSDGRWAWPNDLGYYVDKYDLGIDEEFVGHVLASSSLPTSLNESTIREVEKTLFV